MRRFLTITVLTVMALAALVGTSLPAGAAVLNPDKGLTVQALEGGHASIATDDSSVCVFTAKIRVHIAPKRGVHQLKARFQLYPPSTTVIGSVASTGMLKSPLLTASNIKTGAHWDFRGTIRMKDTIGTFDYKVTAIGDRDAPHLDLALSKVGIGDNLTCGGAGDARRKAPPKCPTTRKKRLKARVTCITATATPPPTTAPPTTTTAPPPPVTEPPPPPATEPPPPPATDPPAPAQEPSGHVDTGQDAISGG